MIPLYMDEHIPRAVTVGLRLRGLDVLTVQEDGFSGKSDPELLNRASSLKRVIFSHDDDILVEAVQRQRSGKEFFGVIYAHPLKVSIGICVKDIELLAKFADIKDIENQVIFLPLSR